MGVPKRLTEMQKRFAEYLVFGGPDGPLSKSEAAELAGYSPKRSRVEGSELTNPRHSIPPLIFEKMKFLKRKHRDRPLLGINSHRKYRKTLNQNLLK